ncbi:hypothetical protein TEA_004682 [Camellia sinensis var. sinensis]|uniref:Uncharacterized protein n=1 Tax=Camellia sinensis var. sinensis TaxID=542762 RepID=A0A4S4F376_CAMSN|nr:hypothetical protein TEA_004682 [Camellia sinensis var. sinensis]
MFWRERERENKELNSGPPCGQVRVLVVGDSGVGKTSLVHLIVNGSSIAHPPQTIGCTVGVKHTTYGNSGSSSNSIKGDGERDFFIELWDVSGHDRYKDCRRTKTSLQKWAADIATTGTFSAPLGSGGPGGLPVPYIVIANKADIASKEGTRGSSGNLVDAARQWVEKQGLLPSSEELPLTESFPGSGGLIAAAKEARYDKEAVMKFFRMLIRRRYFSDGLPAPNPWSSTLVQRPLQRSSESLSNEDQLYKSTGTAVLEKKLHPRPDSAIPFSSNPSDSMQSCLLSSYERLSYNTLLSIGDPYKYNILPPLPAQHNLTPPPTLYPQQPMSTPDNNYNTIPRFALSSSHDISSSSSARSKRTDINV